MTNLHTKQKNSVIISLHKKCEAFYEKHPGAWKDPEQARWLTDGEQKLMIDLERARTMIEMRKAANEFYETFTRICRATKRQEVRSDHPEGGARA